MIKAARQTLKLRVAPKSPGDSAPLSVVLYADIVNLRDIDVGVHIVLVRHWNVSTCLRASILEVDYNGLRLFNRGKSECFSSLGMRVAMDSGMSLSFFPPILLPFSPLLWAANVSVAPPT